MQLKNLSITKHDIKSAIPELLDEILSVQKLKKDSSKINFGQIQKLMFEKQQANLIEQVGFSEKADLVRTFFGIDNELQIIDTYAGMMVPHVMGENIKSVDDVICEIFEKETTDINWYKTDDLVNLS